MKCDLVSRRSLLLGRLFWRGASVYGPSIVNNDRAKWVNGDIAAAVYYTGPDPCRRGSTGPAIGQRTRRADRPVGPSITKRKERLDEWEPHVKHYASSRVEAAGRAKLAKGAAAGARSARL